jgi:hypothetical protein
MSAITFADCLVVIWTGSHGHFVFLSAEDQIQLPYRIVQILPWNHFGRKNVGWVLVDQPLIIHSTTPVLIERVL